MLGRSHLVCLPLMNVPKVSGLQENSSGDAWGGQSEWMAAPPSPLLADDVMSFNKLTHIIEHINV